MERLAVKKIGLSGGKKMDAKLRELSQSLAKAATLRAGFLEDATYADGTPVAYVASIQEFGGTWTVPAHTVTVFKKFNFNTNEYYQSGRFVKKNAANVETDHDVKEYSVTVPSRPFFRNMIAAQSSGWGDALGALLKNNKYDAKVALSSMGKEINGQLIQSITDTNDPPNAPSTIAKKGFNKPLIDTGFMRNSTGYEVN